MGIFYLNIEHTINMKCYIIFSYGYLWWDFNNLFSCIMYIFYLLNERYFEVKTWLHLSVELWKSMNQTCIFFSDKNNESSYVMNSMFDNTGIIHLVFISSREANYLFIRKYLGILREWVQLFVLRFC